MVTFTEFQRRCKMRHDFDDQIQVRYQDGDQEGIDTWVSGSEALQRLQSEITEAQLRALSRLSLSDLRIVLDELPDAARDTARRSLRDTVADQLEATIGGNVIGDALSDSVRGRSQGTEDVASERDRWRALFHYEPFRQQILELAWRQLEGSLPDDGPALPPDDWL